MKELVEDLDIIEDIEELSKEKEKIIINSLSLARLFLRCYDYLFINIHLFKSEDKNYSDELEKYLNLFKVEDLRSYLEDITEEYGIYYLSLKIKNFVKRERKRMVELIQLFFKLFGEND